MVKKAPSKNRKWIHVLLWGVMILYLFIAPVIKDKVTIVTGKPVNVAGVTLESSDNIVGMVDRMTEAKVDGQWVYRFQGWSYIKTDMEQANYDVYLVFANEGNQYIYATTPYSRADVEAAFPEVESDLSNSGFDTVVAKELMANGTYDVGLLYKHKTSGAATFQLMDKVLIKTINDIKLEDK